MKNYFCFIALFSWKAESRCCSPFKHVSVSLHSETNHLSYLFSSGPFSYCRSLLQSKLKERRKPLKNPSRRIIFWLRTMWDFSGVLSLFWQQRWFQILTHLVALQNVPAFVSQFSHSLRCKLRLMVDVNNPQTPVPPPATRSSLKK